MTCSKDDTGTCCGVCGPIVAVIPVLGRLPLLKHTITRLLKKCSVDVVICIGGPEERHTCQQAGAIYFEYKNHPLGDKWNFGFQKARECNPFAVLFVGSSDWVTDNWVETCRPYLRDNGMVGKAGCHFLDIRRKSERRLVHWAGYSTGGRLMDDRIKRKDEPIGGGRMIASRVLDKINWTPFESKKDNSLDWHMYNKTLEVGEKVKIIDDENIHIMGISTDAWQNKHQFEEHWRNHMPSQKIHNADEFLTKHFPEALNIF